MTNHCDPIADNIDVPITKSIVKYRSYPSILAIGEVCDRGKKLSFAFSQVDREETLKEIANLDISNASQDTDIPTKPENIILIYLLIFFCLVLTVRFQKY